MKTSHIEIIKDIVTSSNTSFTVTQIENAFQNEIALYNSNEIEEIELYEIISIAIDNHTL